MAGKPIICLKSRIKRNILQNEKNCLLCEENVNEWIDAIQLLKDNHDLANLNIKI